jgi:FAD/FMN-containing dehydrogenase
MMLALPGAQHHHSAFRPTQDLEETLMKRRSFILSSLAAAATGSMPRFQPLSAHTPWTRARSRDVVAVTGDGREVTLTSQSLADLAARLRGRLLLAGDEGYDAARMLLNPSFDKRPALIAQVAGAADVRAAVEFAREHGNLLLAVKCGGHSASGKSTCERGMMIDLSPFRDVRVDPVARRARVTGGSLLGAVDHEAMAYGLVVPMGTVSHTGVGGLVTGGGFGRLARRWGLSIDNLTAVDVIDGNGRFHRASEDENADLFWGVRGGGGNFGVVTSFEFGLHPMQRQVLGGRIAYPLSRARDVFRTYAEYGPVAPDELQLDCGMFVPGGGGAAMALFGVCYSGPPGEADRVLAPLRRLGTPLADTVQPIDYVALQRSGDMDDPRASGQYVKSGFVAETPDALISAMIDNIEQHPTRMTQVFFQQSGGAINRVATDATAFAQRDVIANMLCFVNWRHGEDPADHIQWIREYWQRLDRFTHGFYVNDIEDEHTAADVRANYRRNHERLVAVKNRYDPMNLFRLNANVQPTV